MDMLISERCIPMQSSKQHIPSVSVIICAYTEQRWDHLVRAVESVRRQTLPASEVIVVIDHNPALLARAKAELASYADVISNIRSQGLCGSRNAGVHASHGATIAFLDDDAVAEANWLEQLVAGYDRPDVAGVGGWIVPDWAGGRPPWFPEEFYWVVGCSYRGLPTAVAPVRNLIGCNMSFRREIIDEVGGFTESIGHKGGLPHGDDETDFCIRVRQHWPQKHLIHRPQAVARHHVPANRANLRYLCTRCYLEGRSKALLAKRLGTQDSLSSERTYTFQKLPKGLARGLLAPFQGDIYGVARAGTILCGFAATASGYAIQSLQELMRNVLPRISHA
jgi:hypothetical protein